MIDFLLRIEHILHFTCYYVNPQSNSMKAGIISILQMRKLWLRGGKKTCPNL